MGVEVDSGDGSTLYSNLHERKFLSKEIPSNLTFLNFHQKYEIAFNFTKEIPLKINRTKKKVHQKIELTFSFTKKIPLKSIRNKKKNQP